MNKLTLAFALIAATTITTGCDGGGSSSGAAASDKDADGLTAVPNVSGVRAKVPDNAKPNGVGGAPGFHTDDDSFKFTLQEMTGADLDKTVDEAKAEAEEIMFKKWIASEATDDGWVLTYEAAKLDLSGDEPKEVGTMYSFEVRKKVGDKTFKCYGAIDQQEGLTAVVDACKSLKAG